MSCCHPSLPRAVSLLLPQRAHALAQGQKKQVCPPSRRCRLSPLCRSCRGTHEGSKQEDRIVYRRLELERCQAGGRRWWWQEQGEDSRREGDGFQWGRRQFSQSIALGNPCSLTTAEDPSYGPLAFVARGVKLSENVLSPMHRDMLAVLSGCRQNTVSPLCRDAALSEGRLSTPNTKDRTVIAPVTSSTLLAASLFELLRSWTTSASMQGCCQPWLRQCLSLSLSPVPSSRVSLGSHALQLANIYRASRARFLGMD